MDRNAPSSTNKQPNQECFLQFACTVITDPGLSNTLVVFRLQVSCENGGVVVEEKELVATNGCTWTVICAL